MWTKLPAALKWITAVHHGTLDDTLHQLKTRSFAENSSLLRKYSEGLHKTERPNSVPPSASRRFDTLHPKHTLCPHWSLLHSTNQFPEKYNYLIRTQSSKGSWVCTPQRMISDRELPQGRGGFCVCEGAQDPITVLTDQPDCLVFTGFS